MVDALIDRLIIYPIKSCRGIELTQSRYTPDGLEHDRQWMIVDAETLKACTARSDPEMVLIDTSIEGDFLRVNLPRPDNAWSWRSRPSFTLPLRPSSTSLASWESFENLDLWSMSLTGISPPSSDPSNVLLSAFFKKPVRIVQKFGSPRGPGKKAPKEQETGYGAVTTVYADTYPLHLLTLQTISSLAQSLANSPLSPANAEPSSRSMSFDTSPTALIHRFRPNIVLRCFGDEGESEWPEDDWGSLVVGEKPSWGIQVVGRCGRCLLPNVDPSSGARHPTLPYRLLTAVRPKEVDEFVGVKCPTLGVYAVPIRPPSAPAWEDAPIWRTGDSVQVLTRRENPS